MDKIIDELCSPKPLPIAKSVSTESLPNSSEPPSSKKQRRPFIGKRRSRAGSTLPSGKSDDKRKRSLDKTLAILSATLNNGGRRPTKKQRSTDQCTVEPVETSVLPVADQPPSLQLVLCAPDIPDSGAIVAVDSLVSSSSAPSVCGSTESATQSSKGKQKAISIFEKLEVCRYADELKAAGTFREANSHSRSYIQSTTNIYSF